MYDDITNFLNTIHPEDLERVLGMMENLRQAQCVEIDYRIVRPDGQVRWIRDRGFPIRNERGELYRIAGIAWDISEPLRGFLRDRKQAEQALRESELKFRTLAETIPVGIGIYQGTKICYVNPASTDITGYTEQDLLTMNFWEIFPPDIQELIRARGLARLQGERVVSKEELKIITKNGELRWIDFAAQVIEFQGKPAVLATSFDITSRKQPEEALYKRQQEFETLVENSPDIIARFDKNLRHLYVNRALERVTGNSPQNLIGKNTQELGFPESLALDWQQKLLRVFATGQSEVSEFDLPALDGIKYYQARLVPEFSQDGSVEFVLSISRDITQKKQAEEQLKASLREKEVLLQEVHHRVKNNLQVISSLLDLQSLQIQDRETLEIFQASQNRVRSMALIHEKLYQSPNLDRINFADYLKNLTKHLLYSYAVNPDNINLHLNLQDIYLNVDTAVPCGLIVNELVSNALKHAFLGQRQGQLWLELKSENNQITLEVRDDGIISLDSLQKTLKKSLGMQLVEALVGQLEGELEIDCSSGTAFKIRFFKVTT